ncbi:hypothetical protein ASPZODRAFT_134757 [Penicilliopsis zonata CBS 506.65]|uniref:Uncharacterized protein n=1 Tax=Penicilliopsis zonata CBS 506.65 TaxID=1073090 RepID=A0A1L9SC06_9EURO|nr:hypothetical protein ASPZODRAFT_134757 [Penicilliopsis zonata CBS 506.65]OJJ44672.1 hypothetical protein ASPZODRAFT_134757 [Penicilliopsis zonata CBS 506.65]
MSAQGPNPLPPTTILSTRPISQSAAHDFLAAYLDRAATDPALQPNASISEHGPVSRTTAAAPNLILHNLKRVQAGLAGEVLGRDLTFIKLGEDGNAQVVTVDPSADENALAQKAEGEGWEDAQQWQQRDEEADAAPQDASEDPTAGALDKEERKRKKKERRLAEKRAKANATEE